ncbi:MAG: ribose-phosphate diphosphokinase [Enterobacteriaceae bacterium]
MLNTKIFSGSSIQSLSKSIVNNLNLNLGKIEIKKFNDGEISVKINESVRGKNVFVIQSLCTPVNDNLMELIFIVDALKKAFAKKITAIITYLGYSRQDRKIGFNRSSITSKVIANLISNSGLDDILTIELHVDQIQGFFNIPIDNISSNFIFSRDIISKKRNINSVIVSLDVGGINRINSISKLLKIDDIAIINKKRSKNGLVKTLHIIGNVYKKNCILVDDIIDTGNTLINAINILNKNKVNKIFVYITHPVFSLKSLKDIKNLKFEEIVVCNTIPLNNCKIKQIEKIRILDLSKLLAKYIKIKTNKKSIRSIFNKQYLLKNEKI